MRPLPRSTAPIGALIAFAAATLSRGGLPLQHVPGPGSALLFTDLAAGSHTVGWSAALLAPLYRLLGLGALAAWTGPAMMAAAALGLGMFVEALVPRGRAPGAVGALAAALLGLWAPAWTLSWLFGPDLPAWGLSWLGLGLTAWASRRGALGLAALGIALLELGFACKATALPLVATALALPFTAPQGARWRRGLELVALALLPLPVLRFGIHAQQPWLAGMASEDVTGPGSSPWSPLSGWTWAVQLADRGHPQGVVPLLALLASLGAVLGPVGRARWPLLLAALLGVELTSHLLQSALQPRYILSAALPLLALAALLPAGLVPRGGPARWACVGLLVAPFALDSLASRALWERALRATFEGTPSHRSPAAPTRRPRMRELRAAPEAEVPLLARYAELNRSEIMDITDPGAPELMEVAAALGRPQVLGLRVRDRRELHGKQAAEAAGAEWRTVSCERCCPGGCGEACAKQLVLDLRASSAALLLPLSDEGLKPDDKALMEAIYTEAGHSPGDFSLTHWHVLLGSGAGRAQVCRPKAGPGGPQPVKKSSTESLPR